jgi:hypothetical protein
MKKTRSILCMMLAAICVQGAQARAPAKPVQGIVNAKQVDQIKVGQSRDEVVGALGKPKNVTKWFNGTTSLAYKLEGGTSGNTAVFVDVDTKSGKVLQVTVKDQNSGDNGSGGSGGGAI